MVWLDLLKLLVLFMQNHNMSTIRQRESKENIRRYRHGFVLPFTMLISVLILFVTTSALTLLSKQTYSSRIYRQSQSAYYAADDAMACALSIDDTYVGADGMGIFPSSTTTDPSTYIDDVIAYVNAKRLAKDVPEPTSSRTGASAITCGQAPIFEPATSSFAISPTNYVFHSIDSGDEEGKTEIGRAHV